VPRSARLPLAASILLLAAGFAVLPGVWATVTIRQAFFDTLGMGAVYHRHYTTERDLVIVTVVALVLLAIPLLLVSLRVAAVPDRDGSRVPNARRAVWSIWVVLGALSALLFGKAVLPKGDAYLAARNAVSFGRSYAGHDVAYYVFELPLVVSVLRLAAFALVLLAIASGTVYAIAEQRRRGSLVHAGDARRAGAAVVAVTFVYGGLALLCLGLAFYLDRNSSLVGGDDLISGADKATRVVEMPSQAVIGVMIVLLGIATCALAFARLRRHLFLTTFRMAAVAGGVWIGTALVLTVLVTFWWAVLLAFSVAVTVVLLRLAQPSTEDRPNLATAHGVLRRGKVDGWPDRAAWAAFVVLTSIVGGAAPSAGAGLYDHFTLSGPRYQNQRSYIERSIESTRYGFNLDQVRAENAAGYKQNGVTLKAIQAAPASVASLRFLSLDTIQPACELTQAIDQFYNCGEAHIDRYTFDNVRRTMFVMPRLVDWSRVTGFQRQHFAYTSGCGLVMSPVNQTDKDGKPVFTVNGIPQAGVSLPKQELYFGDDASPWAMVDTSQNQFDCLRNLVTTWNGKGIKIGDHRLALALFLGGLPYIGGGRQFWNSTDGNPAGADSQVLLYRGMRTRLERLAPFFEWDSSPYYVAADGHAYVIDVGYAATDRLPYSEPFGGVRYIRSTVLAVMDAYSGATKLYVLQPNEPITATWMKVYPSLFTPLAQLPPALRAHVKYGEDAFDIQAAALARYHVTSAETFYNGDQAWAFTEEIVGAGIQGERVVSPSRYTFLVLPGDTSERFAVVRSYKPAAQGKGIGFSGWLAVDSEPDRFGQATVLEFPQTTAQANPLISLDNFTANVGRDPNLSQQITTRGTSVLRGDTLVVPIGEGLLYVQPLYLDTPGSAFPSLWQVVVGTGDNAVYAGTTFQQAVTAALGGGGSEVPANATIQQLVQTAANEFAAYQAATGAGKFAEAAQHLQRMGAALAQAQQLAAGGTSGTGGAVPSSPTTTAPSTTAPAATTSPTTTGG